MEIKADYLSILSHELRNPLNSMISIIDLASKAVDDESKLIRYLEKLKHISNFMLSINDYFFDFCQVKNKKHVVYHEEFELNEFIDDVYALLEVQTELKNQKLEIVKNGLVAHKLVGDTLRLKQVLVNLLANANKYTPQGGEIILVCDEKILDEEAIVRFTVKDNGIGMSQNFIKMMFQPYAQESSLNRDIGTGLGMYIVKEIVRLIGGTIEVCSEVGKGTTVIVSLRLPLSTESQILDFDFKGKRFLLADDCEINLEVIEDILREKGGETDIAADGEVALQKYLSSPVNYYQMIIVDIRMPKLDGINLARKIRKTKRDDAVKIPIIALSAGLYFNGFKPKCKKNINGFIVKPFTVKHFYQVVGKLLMLL
ncbi:MAG: ATP-binding protein [Bacilli bacterium]|nr:ATP-binding protein [Bacilli bacterium]MDD4077657.1 ATP-binding protein [Bacilli bacterium]MDD4388204.1 ATP-binding protein [Bacilli bacterium]